MRNAAWFFKPAHRIRASGERFVRNTAWFFEPARRIRASDERFVRNAAVTRAARFEPARNLCQRLPDRRWRRLLKATAQKERRGSNHSSLRLLALAGRADTAGWLEEPNQI